MGQNNRIQIVIVVVCFLLGLVLFYLGLQSVRKPSILGDNPPPQILFITLQNIFFIAGGILLGKSMANKKES